MIEQQQKLKAVAAVHIESLKQLQRQLIDDPAFLLNSGSGLDYSDQELEVLRQKARYFRQMKRFGNSMATGDYQPY